MIFRIKLAERIVEIHSLYDEVQQLCSDYLIPVETSVQPDIVVEITPEDIRAEEVFSKKEEARRKVRNRCGETKSPEQTVNDLPFSDSYLETIAVHRKIATAMTAFDTFVMHGTVVATDGQGYMITAPSGTGKTTRAKLWIDHIPNSIVVNGDKPLIRVTEDTVYAYGTPWCGKEGWNTNIGVPLRAIFLLERAGDGVPDSIEEVGLAEAFPALLRQTFRPEERKAWVKTLQLVKGLNGKVKVLRMRCAPMEEAVRMAWVQANQEKSRTLNLNF